MTYVGKKPVWSRVEEYIGRMSTEAEFFTKKMGMMAHRSGNNLILMSTANATFEFG